MQLLWQLLYTRGCDSPGRTPKSEQGVVTVTDSNRLDGQAAIVTGAAQGIGKGIALVLAEAGAAIAIGDIQDASATVDEIRAGGGMAVSMTMDTSKPEDARSMVLSGFFNGRGARI